MGNRHQTGLWIDGAILFSDLTWIEKGILADILILSKGSNEYHKTNPVIARVFNCSTRTVTRTITSLKEKGLIEVSVTRPYGTVKADRKIIPCYNALAEYTKDKCSNC